MRLHRHRYAGPRPQRHRARRIAPSAGRARSPAAALPRGRHARQHRRAVAPRDRRAHGHRRTTVSEHLANGIRMLADILTAKATGGERHERAAIASADEIEDRPPNGCSAAISGLDGRRSGRTRCMACAIARPSHRLSGGLKRRWNRTDRLAALRPAGRRSEPRRAIAARCGL